MTDPADAYDRLVARVWEAATGETREGPANTEDLLRAVADLRAERDALALTLQGQPPPSDEQLAAAIRQDAGSPRVWWLRRACPGAEPVTVPAGDAWTWVRADRRNGNRARWWRLEQDADGMLTRVPEEPSLRNAVLAYFGAEGDAARAADSQRPVEEVVRRATVRYQDARSTLLRSVGLLP